MTKRKHETTNIALKHDAGCSDDADVQPKLDMGAAAMLWQDEGAELSP